MGGDRERRRDIRISFAHILRSLIACQHSHAMSKDHHCTSEHRKQHNEYFLERTQLCQFHVDGKCMKGGWCKFAHRIQDLQPPPKGWTKCMTHWWSPEKELPRGQHLLLIMNYIDWSVDPLTEWADQLQTKVIESKELEPSPKQQRTDATDAESITESYSESIT